MKYPGFFLLEGLIAITVFCILASIAAAYLNNSAQLAHSAKNIHYQLQSLHDPTLLCETKSIRKHTITIQTPQELRSIIKEPIIISYKQIVLSEGNKK